MLWNQKFAFGLEVIDKQHQELFRLMELIKELTKLAKEGDDCYDEIDRVLHELENYTREHFEDEEALLEKVKYDDLENHRAEHTSFVNKVNETLDSDIDLHQEGVLEELYNFLLEWVSNHILFTDVKYVNVLKENL